jgi:hypothetical protein
LKSRGYGEGAYGVGGYGTASLQIETENADGELFWIEASLLIEDAVILWKNFFLEHSPYKNDLPQHGYLTEFKD